MVQGSDALLGDVAFIPRPHTADSTQKAADEVLTLGVAVDRGDNVDAPIWRWESGPLMFDRQFYRPGPSVGDGRHIGTPACSVDG